MLCVPCASANGEAFADIKSRAHIYIYVASHDMNIGKHMNALICYGVEHEVTFVGFIL